MASPVIVGTALIVIVTASGMKLTGFALTGKGVKMMRLINADKLTEVVMTTCLKEIDILGGPVEGMSIALDKIYNAPTVNTVRTEKGEKSE